MARRLSCITVIAASSAPVSSRPAFGIGVSSSPPALGLVFGLARGALLVVLAYLLLQVAFKDAMPDWVAKAKTKEYLDQGKTFLERVNPEEWLERGRKAIEDRNKKTTP